VPAAPRLGRAVRDAATDFYFNSWRLVPANAVWGVGLLLVILLGWSRPALLLLLVPLLAFPTVGIFRLAVLIARGESVAFSDSLAAWRAYFGPTLLAGVACTALSIVFLANLTLGVTSRSPLGWALATFAAWGLVTLWTAALVFWPLLVDPRREGLSLRQRLRLTSLMVFAFPIRLALLALAVAVVLVISTFLFAALLTISVAFCALIACHYVLPAADRFEGRATVPVPD
jgi:uncharacterized membrane protein YesL